MGTSRQDKGIELGQQSNPQRCVCYEEETQVQKWIQS
jgi:hypothetical protein